MEIRRQRWKASDLFLHAALFRENWSTVTAWKGEEKSRQRVQFSGAIAWATGYIIEIQWQRWKASDLFLHAVFVWLVVLVYLANVGDLASQPSTVKDLLPYLFLAERSWGYTPGFVLESDYRVWFIRYCTFAGKKSLLDGDLLHLVMLSTPLANQQLPGALKLTCRLLVDSLKPLALR
jgi:hypothetical protein